MIEGKADEITPDPDALVDSADVESLGDPGEPPREPLSAVDLDEAAAERLFDDLGDVSLEPRRTDEGGRSETDAPSGPLTEGERAAVDALFAEIEAAVSRRVAEKRSDGDAVEAEIRDLLESCEMTADSPSEPDGSPTLAGESFVWAAGETGTGD